MFLRACAMALEIATGTSTLPCRGSETDTAAPSPTTVGGKAELTATLGPPGRAISCNELLEELVLSLVVWRGRAHPSRSVEL